VSPKHRALSELHSYRREVLKFNMDITVSWIVMPYSLVFSEAMVTIYTASHLACAKLNMYADV
jgi:hypothetical protein